MGLKLHEIGSIPMPASHPPDTGSGCAVSLFAGSPLPPYSGTAGITLGNAQAAAASHNKRHTVMCQTLSSAGAGAEIGSSGR